MAVPGHRGGSRSNRTCVRAAAAAAAGLFQSIYTSFDLTQLVRHFFFVQGQLSLGGIQTGRYFVYCGIDVLVYVRPVSVAEVMGELAKREGGHGVGRRCSVIVASLGCTVTTSHSFCAGSIRFQTIKASPTLSPSSRLLSCARALGRGVAHQG